MRNSKQSKILNTIAQIRNSHSQMVNIFTLGSCLNFHLILRSIYPESILYFNIDHVITKIDDKFYDINGVVRSIDGYYTMDKIYDKKTTSRAFTQMYNAEYSIEIKRELPKPKEKN